MSMAATNTSMPRTPSAGGLRVWVRRHRRRPGRDWAEWYYVTFAVVLVGSMAVSLARGIDLPLIACAPAASGCQVALELLPLTWIAVASVLAGAIGSLVGPVAVTAATASWLLATPVDRTDLLSPQLDRLVLAGLVVGVLSGVAIWLITGSPWWLGASASAAALALLSAALAQQGGLKHLVGSAAVTAVAWAASAVFILVEPGSATLVALGITAALMLLAWRTWRHARTGLGSLSRFRLAQQGRDRVGLAGAVSSADAGLLLDLVAPRLAASGSRPILPRSVGRRASDHRTLDTPGERHVVAILMSRVGAASSGGTSHR